MPDDTEALVGLPIEELDTPALLVDLDLLEANINRMAAFFAKQASGLRPHSKTHKCPQIAHMQIEAGAVGITCAKLGEAEVIARSGITDILVANQVVGAKKIARLIELAKRSDVMVALDDADNAQMISQAALTAGTRVRVLVEIDSGMGRCGVLPGEPTLAMVQKVLELEGLRYSGLMAYEGHCVLEADPEVKKENTLRHLGELFRTKGIVDEAGIESPIISSGGTGTYHITGAHPGVTEVQAGTYATMDARYKENMPEFDNALTVLVTTISRPNAETLITDAGMKAVTPEFGMPAVVAHPGLEAQSLAEEHGLFSVSDGARAPKVGDTFQVIPGHGCTTFNLHEWLFAHRAGAVEAAWPVAARGKFQ
jgi:D-serine deaminase-like pyridoxal phosphate-dependent protein